MPTTCGFPKCKFRERYKETTDNRHFYRVPKKPDILRSRWLDAIGRNENNMVAQLRICSGHFYGGEKQAGDVPVADPEIDCPIRIELPSRIGHKIRVLKNKTFKCKVQSIKNQPQKDKTIIRNRIKLSNHRADSMNVDKKILSQIYWWNCMKFFHFSGIMFNSMMSYGRIYNRKLVVYVNSCTRSIPNLDVLNDIAYLLTINEDDLSKFICNNHCFNPVTIIFDTNLHMDFTSLLKLSSLKHIVKLGTELCKLDLKASYEARPYVSVIPTYSFEDYADVLLVFILSLFVEKPFPKSKNLTDFFKSIQHDTSWKSKTIGLLGIDQVGILLASKACLLGFTIIGFDSTHLKVQSLEPKITKFYNFEHFLRSCDCLVINFESLISKQFSLNAGIFSQMKSGSILVNISSAQLLNIDDLNQCIENGSIKAAGINIDSLTSPQIIKLSKSNVALLSMSQHLFEYARQETASKLIQEVRLGLVGCLPQCLQFCVNNHDVQPRDFESDWRKKPSQLPSQTFCVDHLLN